MAHIIFYVSVIVAVVSMITANIIMMRYMLKHLQSCAKIQEKFIATFEVMESAHQTTFEALRATEDFLKYIMETSQSHEKEIARLYENLHQLATSTEVIDAELKDLKKKSVHIDDLK